MHPSELLEKTLRFGRNHIPKSVFSFFQPSYHYSLALIGGLLYGFPSKKLFVIGITGTKGKTTTAEIINAILEENGYVTALAGTLRFKIGDLSWNNMFKMTMPGRFFLQKFLRQAVKKGATHAVIEMTSEGSKQFRYQFIYPNALVFTNLSPEHIESHGSYEKYVEAKVAIGRRVEKSGKAERILVVNGDDKEAGKFLALNIPTKIPYRIADAESVETGQRGVAFTYKGMRFESSLPGIFNIQNMLGAIRLGEALGIDLETIRKAVRKLSVVRGRMERIELGTSHPLHSFQNFSVIVDYAHTPESLESAYSVFGETRKICVLGGTGGGRDREKRRTMGGIADRHCDEIILTDEDPYDEDPNAIVADIAAGITTKNPEVEMDRRKAIRRAIEKATPGDAVLITGKGTDPYIMGPNGAKMPWSDALVAKEELESVLKERHARTS